jgi:hypothetical protein
MDTSKPGPLLMAGGGALMMLGPILDWGPNTSGLSTSSVGLLGSFVFLFGVLIGLTGASRAFGLPVTLPDRLLGFTQDQVAVVLGGTAFLWTFGTISRDHAQFALHLTWIGAALATAGALIEHLGLGVGSGGTDRGDAA